MNNKKLIFTLGILALGLGYWLSRTNTAPPDTALNSAAISENGEEQRAASRPLANPSLISGATSSGSTAAPANRNITGSSDRLNQFLSKFEKKNEWRISRTDDGNVIAISGGMIPGIPTGSEEELSFAQEIANLTGVPGEQIARSETKLEDTPYTEVRQFDQEVGGYQVFGGYMKVFHKKPSGEVYYVANETRNVGDVDLRIKYSFAEARSVVLQVYAGKTGLVVENNPSKPVIYPDRPGHGELAWEILLRIQGPLYDYRHLLVSAISGQILKDITLIKN